MGKQTHTPTPRLQWWTDSETRYIGNQEGVAMADVEVERRVNAHDDLVAALLECVNELEAYEQDRAQADICDRARAALAKVKD